MTPALHFARAIAHLDLAARVLRRHPPIARLPRPPRVPAPADLGLPDDVVRELNPDVGERETVRG